MLDVVDAPLRGPADKTDCHVSHRFVLVALQFVGCVWGSQASVYVAGFSSAGPK